MSIAVWICWFVLPQAAAAASPPPVQHHVDPGPESPSEPGSRSRRYRGDAIIEVDATVDAHRQLALRVGQPLKLHGRSSTRLVVRVQHTALAGFNHAGIPYDVVVSDLQAVLDAEAQRIGAHLDERRRLSPHHRTITEHLPLDEIRNHLTQLATDYPNLVTIETIGNSVEQRPIEVLRISTGGEHKPALFILGGQHAREWVAHSGTLCMTDRLVRGYGNDQVATRLLDRVDYYVVSIANPDGYVYSWTTDRLWRKNRGEGGTGVDLNRNWDVAWGTHSNADPNADDYHGVAAFSEPETRAIADYVQSIPRLRAFVDIHGVAQSIIYPYGYTAEPAINHAEYRALAADMADATAKWGPMFRPIRLHEDGLLASGLASDWAHDHHDRLLAFGYEVAGDMFDSPEVEQACDQVLAATSVLARYLVPDDDDDDDTSDDDDDDDDDDDAVGDDDDAVGDDDDAQTGTDTSKTGSEADDGLAPRGCACMSEPDRDLWWGAGVLLAAIPSRYRRLRRRLASKSASCETRG